MKIVGLTGSFGSGKTTVAIMFEGLGAKIVDADKIVTELYTQKPVQKELQKNFGKQVISKFGGVRKNRLAEIAFSSKTRLAKLNSIVHPKVLKIIKKKLNELRQEKAKIVVLDIPLLFESKSKFEYDFLVVVTCSKKIQALRLRKKGFSLDEIMTRLYAQLSLKKKVESADFVINNKGDFEKTEKQVKGVFVKISS